MRILRMEIHQSPPSMGSDENSEANELVLENTDHENARLSLSDVEVVEEGEFDEPVELVGVAPAESDSDPETEAEEATQAVTALEQFLRVAEQEEEPLGEDDPAWKLTQDMKSDEALEQLTAELASDPENEELRLKVAIAHQRAGNFEMSKQVLTELVKEFPANLVARRYLAISLMHLGEWDEGLLEFETSRGPLTPLQAEFCEDISRLWTGQDLKGKHIVVVSNGRQSDQIQFSRYINEFRKLLPRKVGFVSDPEMVELMRSLREINRVDSQLFEPFDYFIPVESLPLRLNASPDSIPTAPYLHCSPRRVEARKSQFKLAKPLLGICWRDHQPEGPDEDAVDYRSQANSIDLEPLEWHLRELAIDYDLISFQQNLRLDERKVLNSCGCRVLEEDAFNNFEDIAELLCCLDSLITVESPIAHLAGAMGLEGHVLLPFVSDWKWGIEDGVSQWYPSLKIHQKQSEDCWRDCFSAVIDEVRVSSSLSAENRKAS
ncbi:MAG: hypothetical protein P1V20_32625 [Verrucomicrobiales bacterium]|nr:hypothetical protein [Verrucomicrobiales bacterium]